jgi:diadenosine tetraphosphate (Ap4A) HIT family hydrolase
MTDPDCVICMGPDNVVGALRAVWITAPIAAPLPGYVCVVAKRHVEEPFELDDTEASAFWGEAMAVAEALHARLQPQKMNYEIHGNSIRHLHLHIFPRYVGDPFEGRPIDGSS